MSILRLSIIGIILIMSANILKSQTERSAEDAHGLSVGESAPMFKALKADSTEFSLNEEIKNGPVVIIFYRGYWCPVCNKHLGQLQDSLKLIEKVGAQVIAISPQKPEFLDKMAKKTGAEFTLLYDEDYKIADSYDVTFNPSSSQLFTYNVVLGAKLKKTQSDESQRLPIPATYIVNQKGKIIWRQFDPNYKNRSSVKEILNALEKNRK